MRAISLFVMIVLLVLAVFFAMANKQDISLGIWPLAMQWDMPLFLPILSALTIGFFCGGFVSWRAAGRVRKQLRQSMRENRDAAVELDRLKADLKQAQSTAPSGAPQIAA